MLRRRILIVRRILIQCAWSHVNNSDSYIIGFFERLKRRKGSSIAIVAAATHSQDYYFDPSKVEKLRAEYSRLKFGRVVVENKFKKLRRAVTEAFEGIGEDPEELMEEYLARKKKSEPNSEEFRKGPSLLSPLQQVQDALLL